MSYSFLEDRIVGGIGADDRYWESLEDGHFRLSRCADCGVWMWPAHWRCGECGCWDQEWIDVEPRGTVYAWTRTWYSFDRVRERANQVPYVVVVAPRRSSPGRHSLSSDAYADARLVSDGLLPPRPEQPVGLGRRHRSARLHGAPDVAAAA